MLVENCPVCETELEILEDEMEASYTGGGTIRVDAKAYCAQCNETYFGSYYFDAASGEFAWDAF